MGSIIPEMSFVLSIPNPDICNHQSGFCLCELALSVYGTQYNVSDNSLYWLAIDVFLK